MSIGLATNGYLRPSQAVVIRHVKLIEVSVQVKVLKIITS